MHGTGKPAVGRWMRCREHTGPARSLPSHPGEVTSHPTDRTDEQTEPELPAQGLGMRDAVQEQWLQRRERPRDFVSTSLLGPVNREHRAHTPASGRA